MKPDFADPPHWMENLPNERLAHLVRDAARGLNRSLQARLSDHGVAFGHWVFLRMLWEGEGLTQREMSDRAGLMEPTTHAALRKMEALGYLSRKRQTGDRKKMYVFLTDQGRALKDVLVPLAEEVNAVATAGVPETDVATMRRALLAMIRNLEMDLEHTHHHPGRLKGAPGTGGTTGTAAG